MEHLPPVAWADVATKSDLAEFRGDLRAEIRVQSRTLFLALVGLEITDAGLAVAVTRLA